MIMILLIIALFIGFHQGQKGYAKFLTKDPKPISDQEANALNAYGWVKLLLLVLLLLISIYHLFNHQP